MSRLTITLPDVIHNRISLIANESNESMSTIINKLIVFGLNYDKTDTDNNSLVDEHCQLLMIQMNALIKNLSAKTLDYKKEDFESLHKASIKKLEELKKP